MKALSIQQSWAIVKRACIPTVGDQFVRERNGTESVTVISTGGELIRCAVELIDYSCEIEVPIRMWPSLARQTIADGARFVAASAECVWPASVRWWRFRFC